MFSQGAHTNTIIHLFIAKFLNFIMYIYNKPINNCLSQHDICILFVFFFLQSKTITKTKKKKTINFIENSYV